MKDLELENLISAWLDGQIDEEQSARLQQMLIESKDARRHFREMANLDSAIRSLAIDGGVDTESAAGSATSAQSLNVSPTAPATGLPLWASISALVCTLVAVGGISYTIGSSAGVNSAKRIANVGALSTAEQTISGHATLRRAAGIKWADSRPSFYQGDLLPSGLLEFDTGVAEIDFFCGATVVVEGPAKLDIESDWRVRVIEGRLRANVPPAARGFIVKAADSEIVDLGTEFAIEVNKDHARVAVVDGEVELKGGKHDGQHLFTGQSRSLAGDSAVERNVIDVRSLGDIERLHNTETAERFSNWKAHAKELAKDNRLIAYYPISGFTADRFVPNLASSGIELNGKMIGPVDVGPGRFGAKSKSVGFGRPGSRVRALIDGEFEAFTFSCWAKVDSLDHNYNALFMSDGYENGELHWQIHNDGRLMFSVMVDDTPGSGTGPSPESRFHHIYYTPPVWDVSKAGKWMHLSVVYDPATKQVEQYVNGSRVSSETIPDEYHVNSLRIGPAEIGNWGQPLRKSPDFTVRNLNGSIDEMAIFKSALNAKEIKSIYDNGKPFSY